MKKLIAVTGSILIIYLIISGAVLPAVSEKENVNIQREIKQENEKTFVVKEYNGKVAVFQKGKSEPFRTTDMQTSLLPDYDKELLEEGIEVSGKSELNAVLEDFLG